VVDDGPVEPGLLVALGEVLYHAWQANRSLPYPQIVVRVQAALPGTREERVRKALHQLAAGGFADYVGEGRWQRGEGARQLLGPGSWAEGEAGYLVVRCGRCTAVWQFGEPVAGLYRDAGEWACELAPMTLVPIDPAGPFTPVMLSDVVRQWLALNPEAIP
jgi:hypothetical protein